jgi:hypothetical protein
MGLEVKERQIGRATYRVTQLGFKAGRAAMVRLTKLLGPVLSRSLEGANGRALSVAGLAGGVLELSERLSEQDLTYFCELFGEKTELVLDDGKRPILLPAYQETWFAGQYQELFQWLAFCVEVNYADFFGAFRSLVPGGETQEAQA